MCKQKHTETYAGKNILKKKKERKIQGGSLTCKKGKSKSHVKTKKKKYIKRNFMSEEYKKSHN